MLNLVFLNYLNPHPLLELNGWSANNVKKSQRGNQENCHRQWMMLASILLTKNLELGEVQTTSFWRNINYIQQTILPIGWMLYFLWLLVTILRSKRLMWRGISKQIFWFQILLCTQTWKQGLLMLASGGIPLLWDGSTWQMMMCGNSLVILCCMVWIHHHNNDNKIQIPRIGSHSREWLHIQQLQIWRCMPIPDVLAFLWHSRSNLLSSSWNWVSKL